MTLDTALRDSIAMENATTYRALDYACRNIEARHAVEGISAEDRAIYEREKKRHVERVLQSVRV